MLYCKTCAVCGEPFETTLKITVCCGLECKKIRERQRNTKYKRKHKAIAQKKRIVYTKICEICGKSFETGCKTTHYCSRACTAEGIRCGRNANEKDRPFTPDTVMLCHLYRARGESAEQIAKDLDRSRENILLALSTPLPKGRAAVVAEELTLRVNRS